MSNNEENLKSIYVTGGSGYIGSALVPKLLQAGYKVSVLDLMIYGENVLKNHKNLKKIKGDIRDQNLLKKTIRNHDVVIHLACISNDPSFELNPALGKSINLDSFEPIVEISKKSGVKRFIYASSSSVYGLKDSKNVDESSTLNPLTDYSKFKVKCEEILKKYQSEDFTTIVTRPATVCGYAPRQRFDVVVNILTNLAYHKREITVYGGDQLRPNIHINDMVKSYEIFIKASKKKVAGEIFNVGFENYTILNLAKTVKRVLGEDIEIKKLETNDKRSYHISSKKIYNILEFKPNFNIEDAVKDLKKAFDNGLLPNSLTDSNYFNIKKMQSLNLK